LPDATTAGVSHRAFPELVSECSSRIRCWNVFPAETNFPLKKGDPLLTLPISECKENIDFRFQISFDEPQVLQREPLLLTLYQMSDVVDGTIKRFAPLL